MRNVKSFSSRQTRDRKYHNQNIFIVSSWMCSDQLLSGDLEIDHRRSFGWRRKDQDVSSWIAWFAYWLISIIHLFIQKIYFQKFFKDMIIQPWPIPTTTTRAMATITITCERRQQIFLEIDIFGLENLILNEKEQVLQHTYLYSNLSLHWMC